MTTEERQPVLVSSRLPAEIVDRITAIAARERRSVSAQVIVIIEEYFALKDAEAAGG